MLLEAHRVLLKGVQDEVDKAQEQVPVPEVLATWFQDQLRRIDSLQDDTNQLDKPRAAMV